MSFDGFSLYPLVQELNVALAGGRIDKITQPDKHTILLYIRQPGKNHTLYISSNPSNPILNLTQNPMETPAEPPIFCMVLRKQIEDGRIGVIWQHLLDRIVFIDIDIRGIGGMIETKTLAIELMGKYSNLILCKDGMVIDSLKRVGSHISRLRQVLPNQPYTYPPSQEKLNLLNVSENAILNSLALQAELPLNKALLSAFLGFGPVTVKEILFRAQLKASQLYSDLAQTEKEALRAAMMSLLNSIEPNEYQPTVTVDLNQKVLAITPYHPHFLQTNTLYDFKTLSAAIDFAALKANSYAPPEKEIISKIVMTEINKLKNKLDALREDLVEANDAETIKSFADLLMAYQYQLQPASMETKVSVKDFYEPDRMVDIPIDPLSSIVQNAQKYYNKYNKLKRAQELIAQQIEQTEQELVYLSSIETSLGYIVSALEVSEIKTELMQSGYIKEVRKKMAAQKRSRPLKYALEDGFTVFVGKNNIQNDDLTFKTAEFNDIWLHTKDHPGSHVIIKTSGQTLDKDVLAFAAQAAVYFSKARHSSKVAVDYTLRRYVKKPAKAKPGFVIYTHQKTLYITPEEKIILQIQKEDCI